MSKLTPDSPRRLLPNGLGAHFSIAGGYDRALYTGADYGCRTVQVFTKNASTWKERRVLQEDADRLQEARAATGITRVLSHTSYLINLAAVDSAIREKSIRALESEMVRCERLGIIDVVLHPGAHMGAGIEAGIDKVVEAVNTVMSRTSGANVRLLLETTAGQGTSLGCRFEDLAAMMEGITDTTRMGICLDTCHIFAAGYDIRDATGYNIVMDIFDSVVGLDHLHALHVNDCKKPMGARVDRHAHIGLGEIGMEAFNLLMNDPRLDGLPKLLETPKLVDGVDWDRRNFDVLAGLVRKA
jgi:deoxyribonuclease-4